MNEAEFMMKLTPEMDIAFKDLLDYLEIEILQGERKVLKSGMIKYKLIINDKDKQETIKELMLKIISDSHNKNLN